MLLKWNANKGGPFLARHQGGGLWFMRNQSLMFKPKTWPVLQALGLRLLLSWWNPWPATNTTSPRMLSLVNCPAAVKLTPQLFLMLCKIFLSWLLHLLQELVSYLLGTIQALSLYVSTEPYSSTSCKLSLSHSGVGTVVAVTALATTLFCVSTWHMIALFCNETQRAQIGSGSSFFEACL